jgi:hypothetical protein
MLPRQYVSKYFMKDQILNTWNHELYGYDIVDTFTSNPGPARIYVPDLEKMKNAPGRRQTRRIRNDMDESEAGPRVKRCSQCNETGHTYKYCPKNAPVV